MSAPETTIAGRADGVAPAPPPAATAPSPEGPRVIAVLGNPNTGKSTLFTRLTGVHQKIGNYPGVTVEKRVGRTDLGGCPVDLVDLPGTYSLAAHSPDEMIAVDLLQGAIDDVGRPDAVLVVVDAANLRRNLYLASQVLEAGLPVVVALNMVDAAAARGITVDAAALSEGLGAPVVPTIASRGDGVDRLREQLAAAVRGEVPVPDVEVLPALAAESRRIAAERSASGRAVSRHEVERGLIDADAFAEQRLLERAGADLAPELARVREVLGGGKPLAALEARGRYAWIAARLAPAETRPPEGERPRTWTDRIDAVITHKVGGTVIFLVCMAVVFQSVFAWAGPLIDLIDGAFGSLGDAVAAALPEGALTSLLVDGVIAGVGSVLVFLPQILLLFFFIGVLEDTGYMARAAFVMDRTMRWSGLSGQSFIPMLSSFACAIPGIMATRVIPDRRDRLTTILVAPLMSCSARLPVYTVLIAAFIPDHRYLGGWIGLKGLVLLAMYLTGMTVAVLAAFVLKRTVLKGPTPTFLMELPGYKMPSGRALALRLWERAKIFVTRAGTIIFSVTVVVWALAYFPHPESIAEGFEAKRAMLESSPAAPAASTPGATGAMDAVAATDPAGVVALPLTDAEREAALAELEAAEASAYLQHSLFGRIGRGLEPVFEPLGWDWRVGMAVIASFPAREVVIAVLGTTYSLGAEVDADSDTLTAALAAATWPDGRPVFTVPMALGLMVFFALCLQCGATVATIQRETRSWKWAGLAWTYMTLTAYVAALLVFQVGSRL